MKPDRLEFVLDEAGQRLDLAILHHLGDRLSRSQLQMLIRDGAVQVDGRQRKAGERLKGGEQIVLHLPGPDDTPGVLPEPVPLQVIHEDEWLAVIDKPAGMVVHPGDRNERGTLVAAALSHWPALADMPGEPKRAGVVHRLDKDTSGLILLALQDSARRNLMRQFQDRLVAKRYLALLERCPPACQAVIDAPVGRDPRRRQRMAVVARGKSAISEYRVLERDLPGGRALVEVRPRTGRTHQIRVHMAYIDCPIVADSVYGLRKQGLPLARQFLHAAGLTFTHPALHEELSFQSPLPTELRSLLNALRKSRSG
ncbi:MAG: RluA family pseudouridine synthase [Anaerolineaceae bacterium]|nr:RluA family pseudouridine synthase [Anaerolineaceae bacterium]